MSLRVNELELKLQNAKKFRSNGDGKSYSFTNEVVDCRVLIDKESVVEIELTYRFANTRRKVQYRSSTDLYPIFDPEHKEAHESICEDIGLVVDRIESTSSFKTGMYKGKHALILPDSGDCVMLVAGPFWTKTVRLPCNSQKIIVDFKIDAIRGLFKSADIRRNPVVVGVVSYDAERRLHTKSPHLEKHFGSFSIYFFWYVEAVVDCTEGYILGIGGYEDAEYWTRARVDMPKIMTGKTVKSDRKLLSKVGDGGPYQLDTPKDSDAVYDEKQKILRLGPPAKEVYQILSNAYVGLVNGEPRTVYVTDLEV